MLRASSEQRAAVSSRLSLFLSELKPGVGLRAPDVSRSNESHSTRRVSETSERNAERKQETEQREAKTEPTSENKILTRL